MIMPSVLLALAVPYAFMLVVPGPNALIILRASFSASLVSVAAAACGIACGAAGAAALAASCAALAPGGRALQTVGALIYAAFLLRAARQMVLSQDRFGAPVAAGDAAPAREQFGLGFANAFLNPVTVPFFFGFFVGHPCPRATVALACGLVFVMAVGYFTMLGLTLARVRRVAVRAPGRRLHTAMAAAMVFFAVRAVWHATLA